MNKTNITIVVITLTIVIAIVAGINVYKNKTPSSGNSGVTTVNASNINITNGTQEITIVAGAGRYSPRITTAKAGLPTVLKIQGKNAYGCESAVRIPQLSYSKNLTPAGTDTVTLGEQKPGATINGMCAMGMYNFQIKFE